LVHYGAGFTHSDVYDLPIHLRKFYLKELADAKKRENPEAKKQDFTPGQIPTYLKDEHAKFNTPVKK